ncbi:MAG: nickel pincer cofactor biosynthesis protein LarB [Fimbriiglobus sp.]|nr:nickel pincer cofactor biosynthesis protein LarB [Fimbriiglobus sp.]
MSPDDLNALLTQVQAGKLTIAEAAARLNSTGVAELPFATVDLDRSRRCGFPEVVLGEGKTADWIEGVVKKLAAAGQDAFVTRVNEGQAAHLSGAFPTGVQDRLARTFLLQSAAERVTPVGDVLVVTAGTGDLPVAQEALVTARVMGANADLIADVGVAGIHRVLRHRARLNAADVVIVVAGMDGALPSVVGGLVDCPVLACPTSIGYGACFAGVAPLLTMLNSCSAGVAVVNIDAGFKAGYVAARIARRAHKA